jgi:hypothetical protein
MCEAAPGSSFLLAPYVLRYFPCSIDHQFTHVDASIPQTLGEFGDGRGAQTSSARTGEGSGRAGYLTLRSGWQAVRIGRLPSVYQENTGEKVGR